MTRLERDLLKAMIGLTDAAHRIDELVAEKYSPHPTPMTVFNANPARVALSRIVDGEVEKQ